MLDGKSKKFLLGWRLTDSPVKFIAKLEEVWDSHYGTLKMSGKNTMKLELHTGGWSENEYIIGVIQKSSFWFMYWKKSERGGHYYFDRLRILKNATATKTKAN